MREIDINKIKPNPHQPRRYFEKQALEVLKETLKKQILPILVIPGTKIDIPKDIKIRNDEFLIIDGERRWRASRELKREKVTCEVLEDSYTEAYDNAGIIHRTSASHDPQARAWCIVESILNHLNGELEKYGWTKDTKGVMSCASYLHHIKERGDPKNIGKDVFPKFNDICKRHGWTLNSVTARLPLDINIPNDLLETIQDGTMAHQTATEFIKVKDKEVREKLIKKIKEKPIAYKEAQKMANILVDKETPEAIKEKVLDKKEDVDLDFEKEKVEAIKEVKKDKDFTKEGKEEIEKKIVEEKVENPKAIVAREKFKKARKPAKLQGISPYEFVNNLSVDLGKAVANFKLLEPIWQYVSKDLRKGLQIHTDELIKLWTKLDLINKEAQNESDTKIKKNKIVEVESS